MRESVKKRFEQFNLHDCDVEDVILDFKPSGKLTAVVIVTSLGDGFIPSLPFEGPEAEKPSSVTKCKIQFVGCMGVHYSNDGTDVDCIFDTEVFTESQLLSEFIATHDKALPEFAGKEQFYHFRFGIYPALIDIIAKDFEVVLL